MATTKQYANIPYIRILAAETWSHEKNAHATRPCNQVTESTEWAVNKIASELCVRVDTGEIFSLERTTDTLTAACNPAIHFTK